MISELDESSSELDILSAKAVPGAMYLGGTDAVSEVPTFFFFFFHLGSFIVCLWH